MSTELVAAQSGGLVPARVGRNHGRIPPPTANNDILMLRPEDSVV
jgi:hypothetical protein